MSGQVEVITCPICLDPMTKPILQCQIGHSMCGDCVTANFLTMCPTCRSPLSKTRNYQLEQLIEGLKLPCHFADNGCKLLLSKSEKEAHEAECKKRKFLCEGRKFAKWQCQWFGNYADLESHFKQTHDGVFEYKLQKDLDIHLEKDFYDVKIISFFNGSELFWYKHKVDTASQRVYWIFQYIGPQTKAKEYFYEFEISCGPVRKFKVTEICENDVVNTEKLFKDERCVALAFNVIRSFLNEGGKLSIKFRIMHVKKRNETSK